MEIFSEFDKIINGSLLLDMHYWASSVRMDLFARWGFPSPFDHRDAMATRSFGSSMGIWYNLPYNYIKKGGVPMADSRKLKVYEGSSWNYKSVPEIILKGD